MRYKSIFSSINNTSAYFSEYYIATPKPSAILRDITKDITKMHIAMESYDEFSYVVAYESIVDKIKSFIKSIADKFHNLSYKIKKKFRTDSDIINQKIDAAYDRIKNNIGDIDNERFIAMKVRTGRKKSLWFPQITTSTKIFADTVQKMKDIAFNAPIKEGIVTKELSRIIKSAENTLQLEWDNTKNIFNPDKYNASTLRNISIGELDFNVNDLPNVYKTLKDVITIIDKTHYILNRDYRSLYEILTNEVKMLNNSNKDKETKRKELEDIYTKSYRLDCIYDICDMCLIMASISMDQGLFILDKAEDALNLR